MASAVDDAAGSDDEEMLRALGLGQSSSARAVEAPLVERSARPRDKARGKRRQLKRSSEAAAAKRRAVSLLSAPNILLAVAGLVSIVPRRVAGEGHAQKCKVKGNGIQRIRYYTHTVLYHIPDPGSRSALVDSQLTVSLAHSAIRKVPFAQERPSVTRLSQ